MQQDLGREAGRLIDAGRPALAQAAVARQYELRPDLAARYGDGGRDKCVQDAEYHLACLAAAVTYSSPALFLDYAAWAKAAMAAHGVAPEDVDLGFACLRDALGQALPADAAAAAHPYVEGALRVPPEAPAAPPPFLAGGDALDGLARQYLRALLRAERHEACRLVLDAARAGASVAELYLRVFQPCQREVGRLWQTRQLTVAQEHYCTAATQLAMSLLYPCLFAAPRKGRKLVAASASGESHELGLRVVTDLFEADGWDTVYLGADLPAGGVVRAVEQHRADLLAISAAMPYQLSGVEALIAQVRSSEAGRGVKVMVGGRPFNADPDLWRRLGADGSAVDAAEALAVAARLLGAGAPAPGAGRPLGPAVAAAPAPGGDPLYGEMSRLNSELLTAQRELARRNAELERLNERLAEADRRKDEFLAVLAHELRNPLAPLRNAAHLLRQPGIDRPAVQRAGEMMGRQVEQLGRLVDDLLDVARIAQGKMRLRKETVDLGAVALRAAESARPLFEARRHDLAVSVPERPVGLEADPARLEQILSNLLSNAARYTPAGGKVWLDATAGGGSAVLRVRDTGVGIPADKLASIFGLFSQVDRQNEHAAGGLGIGLALVKGLVEMHGGSVEASSGGPGGGSEFAVCLPLAVGSGAEAPAAGATQQAARSLRVLVVDDNEDAAESLAMLLRLWGHDPAVARDGPAALAAAQSHRPEAALLDLSLPGGMDGYEVARRLRAVPGLERTELVALTGWGREGDARRSQEAGFSAHLLKPVDLAALCEALARAGR